MPAAHLFQGKSASKTLNLSGFSGFKRLEFSMHQKSNITGISGYISEISGFDG
jgi:hypothetical protein